MAEEDETNGDGGRRRRPGHGRKRGRSASRHRTAERSAPAAVTAADGKRRLTALAVVVGAIALTVLSAVWLWDAQQAQAYRATLTGLRTGGLPPDEAATVIGEDPDTPLDLFSTGTEDLANAAFQVASAAVSSPDPAVRAQAGMAVARARELVEASLAHEPAQPFLWARLVYLMQLQGAPPDEIRDAIRMSIYFGPQVQYLLLWRIRLMTRMLAYGGQAIEDDIRRDVRLLAQTERVRELLRCENVDLVPVIRRVLRDDSVLAGLVTDRARASIKFHCGVDLPVIEAPSQSSLSTQPPPSAVTGDGAGTGAEAPGRPSTGQPSASP